MKIENVLLYTGVGAYTLSLFLPSIVEIGGTDQGLGFVILIIGWMGVFIFMFAWLANPLLLTALICIRFKKYTASAVLSLAAFILSLQSYAFHGEPTEGPGPGNPTYLGIGFYVWVLSIVCILIYSIIKMKKSNTFKGALTQPRV